MSSKHFSYSSNSKKEYALDNSRNLFIIRFRESVEPMQIFESYPALEKIKHKIHLKDSFSESNTFIYSISGEVSTTLIDEIKLIINQNKPLFVEYIGSLKVFEDTGIYQIYTGNIFIKFRKGVQKTFISAIIDEYGLKIKRELSFSENSFFCDSVEDVGSSIFELCLRILTYDEVEYCHPEMVVKPRSAIDGNEYRTFDGEKNTWVFEKTKIIDAWKYSKGKGIKICVIDDGIDFNHPAFKLAGKIISPKDMHDKVGNRLPQHLFEDKHGTAVSSILVSADEKALGVAPEAQLIPIRATSLGSVLQSDAFYWAIEAQADIIVCSWGPPDGNINDQTDNLIDYPLPPHTDLAIKYAAQKGRNGKGTIIVFAAGNGNEPMKFDKYASHEEVIGVGSVNFNEEPTVYSDYGHPMFCCFPSGDYDKIENGVYRKSKKSVTVIDAIGTKGFSDSDYYQYFDGTSASCPGLAGVIALVLSVNPNLTKNQVKEVIKNSCKKIGKPEEYNDIEGKSERFGHGLLQADLAVKKAIELINLKTMKAVSLHIGINNVDSTYYGQIVPELFGCVNDMIETEKWAKSIGYDTNTLANEKATMNGIRDEILRLGNIAGSDGILLISYSGHGAPLDESQGTTNDVEETGKDQAWVTYDGFLVDDRIHECLSKLPENLRVVVVSDSCFSGSITRVFGIETEYNRKRSITFEEVKAILKKNNQELKDIKFKSTAEPLASIILLSACTDGQVAFESNNAGLFTVEMLKTYKELISTLKTNINYEQFQDLILQKIKTQQQPQFKTDGKANETFKNQFPFSINGTSIVNIQVPEKITVTIPPPPSKFKNIIIHQADGKTKSVNPESVPNQKNSGRRSIAGTTEWDKAYNFAMMENAFVEPDNASNLFNPFEGDTSRSPQEYLHTYPNPEEFGSPNRFIWHLDDDHSQLMRAREMVYPELSLGTKPDFEKQVKIGHIDTGYFVDSPILPENLQTGLSVHIKDGITYEGANDYELASPFNLAEQQGHGNATLALLAGGMVNMNGLFEGYFGAIPFAKVISMKISEVVALISGKNFASAIDYAIANKCDVITMSMAGLPSKVMADAVNRAYEAGIVVVSAASNSFSQGIGSVLPKVTLYPARFDRVIAAVGAAINDAPYLVDVQKNIPRGGEGLYMQTCFGPAEALDTSLAAYTPNITWFSGDFNLGEPLWHFKGGGTSSATPQIAAAAALYIQKYKVRIDTLAGGQKWKKAEIVRQALFRSADKSTQYNNVYGNGLLRATDALGVDFEPEKMAALITTPANIADVSGGFFKNLFRVFSNRALNSNEYLEKMLSLELYQLLHRDSKLNKYLASVPTTGDIMKYGDLPKLIADVKESKLASDFLKSSLINLSLSKSTNGISRGSSNSVNNNFKVESQKGKYFIVSEGISCNINNVSLDNFVNTDIWVDAITIEVSTQASRGNVPEALMIVNENDDFQTAILMENEIDGKQYFEWCFPATQTESNSQARATGFNKNIEGAIKIPLNNDSPKERGIFDKGKKILLKIFKWAKPKIAEKVTKSILSEFLSSLGDSKYELLEFDIAANSWKNFDNSTSSTNAILVMPGLFSTIEKGFTEFFSNSDVQKAIGKRKIIGFNMPTLVQGIEQNAKELQRLLINFKLENQISTILTRSRGGIVARYLIENLKYGGVSKLVMVAPPNEGTQIASSENWSKLLNTATNLANLAFGSYLPILPKLTAIFKAIANNVVNLPGIDDLEIESDLIKGLNSAIVDVNNYYVVVSNFTPDSWLRKIFDSFAVDSLIFKGTPNDAIVPTAGAVFLSGNSQIQLPNTNYHLVGSADSVNHFAYLRTENTEIINWVCSKI